MNVKSIFQGAKTLVSGLPAKVKSAVSSATGSNVTKVASKATADAQKAQAMAQINIARAAAKTALRDSISVTFSNGETPVHPQNVPIVKKTVQAFIDRVHANLSKGRQKMHKISLNITPFNNYDTEFMAKTGGGHSGILFNIDGKQIQQLWHRSIKGLPLDKPMQPDELKKVLTETLEKYYNIAKRYAKHKDRILQKSDAIKKQC